MFFLGYPWLSVPQSIKKPRGSTFSAQLVLLAGCQPAGSMPAGCHVPRRYRESTSVNPGMTREWHVPGTCPLPCQTVPVNIWCTTGLQNWHFWCTRKWHFCTTLLLYHGTSRNSTTCCTTGPPEWPIWYTRGPPEMTQFGAHGTSRNVTFWCTMGLPEMWHFGVHGTSRKSPFWCTTGHPEIDTLCTWDLQKWTLCVHGTYRNGTFWCTTGPPEMVLLFWYTGTSRNGTHFCTRDSIFGRFGTKWPYLVCTKMAYSPFYTFWHISAILTIFDNLAVISPNIWEFWQEMYQNSRILTHFWHFRPEVTIWQA